MFDWLRLLPMAIGPAFPYVVAVVVVTFAAGILMGLAINHH